MYQWKDTTERTTSFFTRWTRRGDGRECLAHRECYMPRQVLGQRHDEEGSHTAMTLTKRMVRFAGFWKEDGDRFYPLYTAVILSIAITLYAARVGGCFVAGDDVGEMAATLSGVVIYTTTYTNIAIVMRRRREFRRLVAKAQSWISYKDSDAEDGRKAAARRFIAGESRLLRFYIACMAGMLSYLLLSPLAAGLASGQFKLPVKMLPLTSRDSVLELGLEYAFQLVCVGVHGVVATALHASNFLTIKCAAERFAQLGMSVRDLGVEDGVGSSAAPGLQPAGPGRGRRDDLESHHHHQGRDRSVEKALHNIIEQHQDLISYTESLGNLLSPVLFVEYIVASALLCMSVYNAVMEVHVSKKLRHLLLANAIASTVFLKCYLSTQLTGQSQTLGDAAYSCRWYEMNSRAKVILMVMIMRTQKPVRMRAGAFAFFSLDLYAKMVNAAYTYYNFLVTVTS